MRALPFLFLIPVVVVVVAATGCSASDGDTGAATPNTNAPPSDTPPGGSPTEPPPPQPCAQHEATFAKLAKSFESKLGSTSSPGGAFAVLCKGQQIFVKGAGSTTKKGGTPVDGATRFQLASMTKLLTATTAVRLARRGVIDLDGPVSAAVPFVNTQAPFDRAFTWTELLSHTAGFTLGFEKGGLDLEARFRANTDVPLWSRPGAVFNYSNEGYGLAGLGLQLAAKKPFADLVEEEIFAPAGMTRSTMSAARVEKEDNFAKGHSGPDPEVLNPTDGYLASTYYGPMGGAWASAEDVAKFARAFLGDRDATSPLITFDERARMTKVRTRAWTGRSFGLGLSITQHQQGIDQYSHSGSVGGYLANLDMFPSEGLAIVVLVNGDEDMPDMTTETFAAFTGKKLLGPTIDAPKSTDVTEHLGTYKSSTLGDLVVQQKSGGGNTASLELVFGKLAKTVPLTPTSVRDVYSFPSPDPVLEGYEDAAIFWRDAQGAVHHIVTLSGVGEK